MLRLTHGEDKIEIRFYHETYEPYKVEGLTGTSVDENRRCTRAIIRLNDTHTSHGTAICHPEDNFCRKIGRKRALEDALFSLSRQLERSGKRIGKCCDDDVGMEPEQIKELRTAIWNEYKVKCNL